MAEIEIYTSPFCGFCNAAKRLLDKKGVAYLEIDVMAESGKREEMTSRSGGSRTVPQIFVDGEYLGDEETMAALEKRGELDAALKIASA